MRNKLLLLLGTLLFVGCGSSTNLVDPISSSGVPTVPAPLVRKSVTELNAQEKARFVSAVKQMKSVPSAYDPEVNAYDYFVELHTAAFEQMTSNAHMNPNFLPWHREYLRRFESELRRVSGDQSITIPYWDWAREGSFEAVFADDFMGGNGDPDQNFAVTSGPFRQGEWTVLLLDDTDDEHDGDIDFPILAGPLQRNFGDVQALFPTQTQVENAFLVYRPYDSAPFNMESPIESSFRNYLEGWWPTGSAMHNGVHVWVGGQMQTASSPNDPLFFLHHAQVDRLWTLYQQIWGNDTFPEQFLDAPLFELDGVTAPQTFDLEAHSGVVYGN